MMISRNSLWSIAGGGIPATAALIFTPYLISNLGLDLFAVASLILSVAIFFYVYDLGMSRTLTYLISQRSADDEHANAELIGSAFYSVICFGGFISICLYLVTPYFVEHWLVIDATMLGDTIKAFQVSIIGVVPGLLSNLFKGVLEGKSKFKEANICKIFSGASVFIAPMIVVAFVNSSLLYISLSIVITRYFALLLYAFFAITLSNFLRFKFKREHLASIWGYGFWAAISGFISTAFVYGDRFYVAGFLTSEDLSIYIASQDILIRYLLIPWSMAIVLMPIFSSNFMIKNDILELYYRQQKRVGVISFVILLIVMLCGIWFTQLFDYLGIPQNAMYIVAIQTVGIFFCSLSQLPLIYLYGKGVPKLITCIFVIELVAYVVIAPWVFSYFGVIGACVVWSSRLIIEYFLLKYYAERMLF